jgi:putative FmdB family regulatory protein
VPTYQYSCTECGHFFEIVQSFSDDSLTVCPVCEGRLRKVFNAVGVVFKGSGFYRNDSRAQGDGAKSGEKKSSAEKTSAEKSSTEKTGTEKTGSPTTSTASGESSGSGSGKGSSSPSPSPAA